MLTLTENWVTIPQKHDIVIFGESASYYRTYRCVGLGTIATLERNITGVTYDPDIFTSDIVLGEELPDCPSYNDNNENN